MMKRPACKLAVFFLAMTAFGSAVRASDGYIEERYSIRLGLPHGYCSLDPSHPADSVVINSWQQAFAKDEQLARAAVECAQRDGWRNPSLLPIDFTQYMVITGWKFEAMTRSQRMALPHDMCEQVRQQSGQPTGESLPSFYARLMAVRQALGVGEYRMIGAIDEEPAACYVVVAAAAKMSTGQAVSVVHVRATTSIQGHVLQFWLTAHTSAGNEIAALQRSIDLLKFTVHAHLAANNEPPGDPP